MSEHRLKEQAKKACDPREFVELLDQLIRMRIAGDRLTDHPDGPRYLERLKSLDERCELTMRELTDYLLVNDKRAGLYVRGEHE